FITIFAVAAAALPDEKRHALTELADVATEALIRIVRWVLLLAPLGIFAIVAGAVAKFGVDLITTMAVFILTVIAGLAVLIPVARAAHCSRRWRCCSWPGSTTSRSGSAARSRREPPCSSLRSRSQAFRRRAS